MPSEPLRHQFCPNLQCDLRGQLGKLNLTVRQGSAYLGCKTACHAWSDEYLDGHLELLGCYYNLVRPHLGLKFGRQTRTPAMQAGLVSRKLTLRDIFTAAAMKVIFVLVLIEVALCPREFIQRPVSA